MTLSPGTQVESVVLWTEKWGLEVNPNKTVIQVYTRKRIEIPIIRLRGCVI